MKIEVTITQESAKQLAEALAPILTGYAAPASPPSTPPSSPEIPVKEKATKPVKEKPAAPAVTLDEVRAAMAKVVGAGKKGQLLPTLEKHFNVKQASHMKPEQYAEAVKLFDAIAESPAEEDDALA